MRFVFLFALGLVAGTAAAPAADLPPAQRAAAEIEAALVQTLPAEGWRIIEADRPLHGLPQGAPLSVLAFDPASGRFVVAFHAEGAPEMRVAGRAEEIALVPVLARDVKPGERIEDADLLIEAMPARRAQTGTARAAGDIAGREARRFLKAGRPVRLAELRAPTLIEKGALVTLVYEAPGISLSITGRALARAARGEVVAVQNLGSNRTVEGIAVAPGRVAIRPAGAPVQSAALVPAAPHASGAER